ncbi:MerR family DNA-binding transcriptional regulator [Desulfosporosinus sp. FKA]|uniref:MerR family DNA-binding transcriptional regulator n=1 Tax=Desulfosporosinus sp. FKA TaxID=1969834 RepID=UPI000B49D917|nr:MerR family DNA-binding transcriptional regulator [Desulfosporosinus sp. FKA]
MSYSIGEFLKIISLSIDTLRYYEKEQLILVERDTVGRRRYTQHSSDTSPTLHLPGSVIHHATTSILRD